MIMSQNQSSNPTVYDLIEQAYSEGASDVEVCKILKIRQRDFEQKYQTNQAFREIVDIGRMMRRAYWMEQGRLNMQNPKFNRNIWLDFMKNEFGWADKSEVVTKEREPSLDEMKMELGPMLKRLQQLDMLQNASEGTKEDGI